MPTDQCVYSSLSEQDRLAIDISIILSYKVSREQVLLHPAKATAVDFMRVIAMDAAKRREPPSSISNLVCADICIRREQIAKNSRLLQESQEKYMMAQINQGLIPEDIATYIHQTPFVGTHNFIDTTKIRPEIKSRLNPTRTKSHVKPMMKETSGS